MDPSANDVFGFTDIDPNMSNYAIASYPYAVRMVTDTENYKTYGESGFIRCYDFYFWIPLSISNSSNRILLQSIKTPYGRSKRPQENTTTQSRFTITAS